MDDDDSVSTEIQVDDETRAALLLFNERVEATAAAERGKKKIAKAERAKDEAAKEVRRVNDNPDATAEQKAEAEAKYKEASDHFQVVQANPLANEPKKPAPQTEEAGDALADEASSEDAATNAAADEDAPAEEAPLAEASADEEAPAAPETPAEGE